MMTMNGYALIFLFSPCLSIYWFKGEKFKKAIFVQNTTNLGKFSSKWRCFSQAFRYENSKNNELAVIYNKYEDCLITFDKIENSLNGEEVELVIVRETNIRQKEDSDMINKNTDQSIMIFNYTTYIHTFHIMGEKLSFDEALNRCYHYNLEPFYYNNHLYHLIYLLRKIGKIYHSWIFMDDRRRKGNFEWVTNNRITSRYISNYVKEKAKFFIFEANTGCVSINNFFQIDYYLSVGDCNEKLFYICQSKRSDI